MLFRSEPDELETIIEKLDLTVEVINRAESVLNTLADASKRLIERVGYFWSMFGGATANEKFFAETFYKISGLLISGIIYPVMSFPETEELKIVIDKLYLTVGIINKAEEVMNTLGEASTRLIERVGYFWSIFSDSTANERYFASAFYRISSLLISGIIYPLNKFPEPEELQNSLNKLDLLSKIINKAESVMNTIAEVSSRFIEKVGFFWSVFKNPIASEDLFASTFQHLSGLLNSGIIIPLMNLPQPEELQTALNKLDLMNQIVNKAEFVMNEMNSVFSRFFKNVSIFETIFGRLDQRIFQRVFMNMAGTLVNGIIDPILQFFPTSNELQVVVDKLDGLVQVLSETERVMSAIAETSANIGQIGIDGQALSKLPIDKLLILANQMKGGGISIQPPKAPDDTLAMGIGGAVGAFGGPLGMMLGALAGKGVAMAGRGIGEMLFGSNKAETAEVSTIPSVASNSNVESKVAAKKASDEPKTNKVTSKELEDISASTGKQTELTQELVNLFKQFVNMVKQDSAGGSSGVEKGPTELNRVQSKSPKYYRPTTGLAGAGPAKQITNLGPPKQ